MAANQGRVELINGETSTALRHSVSISIYEFAWFLLAMSKSNIKIARFLRALRLQVQRY